MDPAGGGWYEFGPFRLDPGRHLLLRGGDAIPLTPKAYEILLALVTRSGALLTKQQLMAAVWGDIAVEENNLNQGISALRKALDDGQNGGRYIETVPRLGYRFVADVRVSDATGDAPAGPRPRRAASTALVALAVGLTVAMAAAVRLAIRSAPPAAKGGARSIAVLPFLTVGNVDHSHLGLGMADAVITRLGNLKDISLRPTSAVDDLGHSSRDAVAAGRKLGVDTVLDGRMQQSEGRLRVTAHLIDVQSRATLWSGSFDEPAKEIFALQDAIAERLANTLVPQLTEEMKGRLGRRGARNIAAYDHYVHGRFLWNTRSRENLPRALHAFQQALEADPTFAEAYVGLADCYNLLPEYRLVPSHEAMPRAKAAALQALRLHPELGEGHASLAYALANYEFDFAAAEREFRVAVDLAPGYATAYQWYAELLVARRRPAEALAVYQRARVLDPLSPIISALVEYTYSEMGEHERAAEGLRRVIALHPTFVIAHDYLGEVYERQQRFSEAIATLQEARRLDGAHPRELTRLRRAYDRGRGPAYCREKLAMELERPYPSPYVVAEYYAHLEERERALEWLEKAYEQRDRFLIFVRVHRAFDTLAGDARFERLLRRVGV